MDIIKYKGFRASIMEAARLEGGGTFGLPPGKALPVHPADSFLKWPVGWMKGPGVFLVPVRPNKGLWFNWTMNNQLNTAVIPTVKGCNPITGLQTSGFHLEKYESKCPKHGCDFMADRYCPECNYKWPDRNYQSMNPSWWDGFRSDDGTVRQFFFTEDELRDVSTALIGKENTVPAFGFAFYRPKEMRKPSESGFNYRYGNSIPVSNLYWQYYYNSSSPDYISLLTTIGNSAQGQTGIQGTGVQGEIIPNSCVKESESCFYSGRADLAVDKNFAAVPASFTGGDWIEPDHEFNPKFAPPFASSGMKDFQGIRKFRSASKPVKDVSIGAGAKISQDLNSDPYPLDSWKEEPEAVMTLYFVFQEKFEELKAGGMRDFSGRKEGMLSGIPVG